jgi:glycosyltransferase involved in cell wall biosynthesis
MHPIIGGTEAYLATLSSSLRKLDVTSEIIALCDTKKWKGTRNLKERTVDGTRALVWPSYPIGGLYRATERLVGAHFLPGCLSDLKRHMGTLDILHFHDEVDLSFPISLRHVKKPKLLTFHTQLTTLPYYRVNPIARKTLTLSADLFHVFSKADMKSLVELGAEARNVRIVPPGIDVQGFRPRYVELQERSVRIACVCRISRWKGLTDLIAAAKILRGNYPTGGFEILIAGPADDKRYYRELLDCKQRMHLDEVSFLGAFAPNRIASFLEQSSIFVLPSLAECFPIVVLEAMASGLPVVATMVGGVPEVMVDGETGFLTSPNDPESLAEKLATLIGDEMLRKEMGRKGRRRAESLFSTERTTRMIFDIYRELAYSNGANKSTRMENYRGSLGQ